jgi:3-hydroxybutyryl-CoA dehydrogenase
MRVVIAGELPLAEQVFALCAGAGHITSLFLVETFSDALTTQRLRADADGADLAIECHNESKDAKNHLMNLLSGARLVLTSALACSTTEAASWAARPEAVAGWGALPPLEKDGMVEVAAGLRTAPETLQQAELFWHSLGLATARVADAPGLVRARVLCALVNEAATALGEGVASAGDIDTAMTLGLNYPRGPLEWGDRIGLDVVLGVMQGLFEEFGEDRYRPSPLLRRYVQAGWLGVKASHGFFRYDDGRRTTDESA